MFKRMVILTTSLLLISAVALWALDNGTREDDAIAADVYNVVENHVFYSVYDIVKFEVKDQVVYLSGYVTEPYKKTAFEAAINKQVKGVKSIVDEIEVLPASTSDSELRQVIATKIYNDDNLLHYAIAGIPKPIHVIVKNGHVTLEGKVEQILEKKLAEDYARSTQGVVSVDNEIQLEGEM